MTHPIAIVGFPGHLIQDVAHAIEAHSFSAGIAPRTLEARILQDADRMEALGAIGLARTFYVAGRLGSKLFDAEDPLAHRRQVDDSTFALDHFQAKLLKLPDTMQTSPGRRIAETRASILRRFMDDLLEELSMGEARAAQAPGASNAGQGQSS